jgi:SAM-dependent methyltransferase
MKSFIKKTVQRIGLFQQATSLVDFFRSLKSLPENFRYYCNQSPDGPPIPPARLLYKVAATSSIEIFLKSGKSAAESVGSALMANKIELRNFSSILDFGCGCGRVIRWMTNLTDAQLYGADFNPSLIRWCQRNLKFAKFVLNQLNPPLSLQPNSFDFIYALSVLTHMNERLQQLWINEFLRILKKGGYLLISVHGKYYLNQMSELEQQQFLAGNLVIQSGGALGSNRFAAYHPIAYLKSSVPIELELLDFIEMGAKGNPHQDLYLFKKKEY